MNPQAPVSRVFSSPLSDEQPSRVPLEGRAPTWRKAAWAMTKAVRLTPITGPVHVTATIHKTTRARYDLDGHAPTVKACIDGIRQAGVLPEDDTTVIPQLTIRAGEPRTRAGVLLRIEAAQ